MINIVKNHKYVPQPKIQLITSIGLKYNGAFTNLNKYAAIPHISHGIIWGIIYFLAFAGYFYISFD